ncbi:MAG: hypothetical protein KDK45_04615 [Leptospiraceae bacterium]|nr:hypothetical protein [Leptospiraceae bacterium]
MERIFLIVNFVNIILGFSTALYMIISYYFRKKYPKTLGLILLLSISATSLSLLATFGVQDRDYSWMILFVSILILFFCFRIGLNHEGS